MGAERAARSNLEFPSAQAGKLFEQDVRKTRWSWCHAGCLSFGAFGTSSRTKKKPVALSTVNGSCGFKREGFLSIGQWLSDVLTPKPTGQKHHHSDARACCLPEKAAISRVISQPLSTNK